jgi:peptide/nickel transport system substrate-binding protein
MLFPTDRIGFRLAHRKDILIAGSSMNFPAVWRGAAAFLLAVGVSAAWSQEAANPTVPALVEPPFFEAQVTSGELPPVGERIPDRPAVVSFEGTDKEPGRYGGTLRLIGGSARDTRLLSIYGYARLVVYTPDFKIVPDIAESVDVEEGRVFTFHLRPGHKWSDGEPFTSEDFRYYWEDIADDEEMSKFGPPRELLVDGEKPKVEFPDAVTVRYSWSKPNPVFLAALAAAQPLEIFRPAHYLKQFHAKHAGLEAVQKMTEEAGERDWVSLHYSKDRSYRNDNPDMPTLQPWVLKTEPPSDRFLFERNPYYYRIDENGLQLPYIDRVALTISNSDLIPAKVAAGEADLQGAYLGFSNYTFLKEAEERSDYTLRRWLSPKGARVALFPNLNVVDPVLRELFRKPDFRRALSVAIDREDINNSIFFGVAKPGNNTVLPESPLFKEEYQTKWTEYDPELANELLDGLGLTERNADGIRLLPNGQPLQIVVETAGEESEQTDVLELVRDHWAKVGVALFIKPSQREVFYNRINSGETQMAVWGGLENALLLPDMSPAEFSPLNPEQFQWPAWGLWAQTSGQMGEKPDLEPVLQIMDVQKEWGSTDDPQKQSEAWHKLLSIWADQVFTIGIVSGVDALVAVSNKLHNVPERGIFNFNPGAYFGMYRPDTFWLES